MERIIALNADCGESYGAWRIGHDEALIPLIDSANIACGFHGGDPLTIRKTLRLAKAAGVGVGAHPSFPDLVGFGRRYMAMSGEELSACISYQLAAFDGMARQEGLRMAHVKPHGALNNAACAEPALAQVVVAAIAAFAPDTILLAPALSHLHAAGVAAGLATVAEIFADRTYQDDGQLTPRSHPEAMVHGAAAASAHVAAMLKAGGIITRSGKILPTPLGSICVHGDGEEAVETAEQVRAMVTRCGWHCQPL